MSHLPNLRTAVTGIARFDVLQVRGSTRSQAPDDVAIEEPLVLQLANEPLTTTLRTPGNDVELVAGFLLAEGFIASRLDLSSIAPCPPRRGSAAGNVVNVELASGVVVPEEQWSAARRSTPQSAACGSCGRANIESLLHRLEPAPPARFDAAWLASLPEQLRRSQLNFQRTGGLHAAGAGKSGEGLMIVREDIGRHNAVDKVVGRLLLDDLLPAVGWAMVVSGRAGFDIVQKAVAAGMAALVSVSAPSSLAVETARAFGLLLIGFTRDAGYNVYAGEARLED